LKHESLLKDMLSKLTVPAATDIPQASSDVGKVESSATKKEK